MREGGREGGETINIEGGGERGNLVDGFHREDPQAESKVSILRVSLSSLSIAYVVCIMDIILFSTCHFYL